MLTVWPSSQWAAKFFQPVATRLVQAGCSEKSQPLSFHAFAKSDDDHYYDHPLYTVSQKNKTKHVGSWKLSKQWLQWVINRWQWTCWGRRPHFPVEGQWTGAGTKILSLCCPRWHYIFGAVDKMSTDIRHRAVPLRQLSLLVGISCKYDLKIDSHHKL